MDVEQHADQQEQGELHHDHDPTRHQGGAALALVARAQKPLHHELIGAVGGGGEKTAACDAGPETVGAREEFHIGREAEIENGEFVGRARHQRHMLPATGNLSENDDETGDGAGHVERHLHHVGPDHRRHAAFKGVEEGEQHDADDGSDFTGAQHNRGHQRYGEHADAFGESARHQEYGSGEFADAFAEAAAHQFVCGEHFAAEVLRQKKYRDHDARQQVAEDDLEESQIAAESQLGGADDIKGAVLSRYDRKGDGPPGRRSPAQEIVLQVLLAAAETGAEDRDRDQVDENNRQIEMVHERESTS